jgi:hypothetical protein
VNGLAVLAEDSWNAASLAASFDLVCIAMPQASKILFEKRDSTDEQCSDSLRHITRCNTLHDATFAAVCERPQLQVYANGKVAMKAVPSRDSDGRFILEGTLPSRAHACSDPSHASGKCMYTHSCPGIGEPFKDLDTLWQRPALGIRLRLSRIMVGVRVDCGVDVVHGHVHWMMEADLVCHRTDHVCEIPADASFLVACVDVQVIGHHLFGHWLESVGHVAMVKNPTVAMAFIKNKWKLGLKNVKRVQNAETVVLECRQDPQSAVAPCRADLENVCRFKVPQAQVQDLAFRVASQAMVNVGHAAWLHSLVGAEACSELPHADQVSCMLVIKMAVEATWVFVSTVQ